MRIATFNLENLDDEPGRQPTLARRAEILRPQLARADADVLCLQEVHSQLRDGQRSLAALDVLLADTPYEKYERATTLTTDGELYHERNLVTLSRFPISQVSILRDADGPRPSYRAVTADPRDDEARPVSWERPVLHTRVDIGDGPALHVMNVHLKSKIATSIRGRKLDSYTWSTPSAWAEGSFVSSMKRVGQALHIRMEIDRIFDAASAPPLIAVCGDFNASEDEVPLRAIAGLVEDTGNPDHSARVMVPCERNVAASNRFSLYHLGRGEMIDHVMVSRALLGALDHTEIHNEYLPDESGAFRTDARFPDSDHAPVVAEFDLGGDHHLG